MWEHVFIRTSQKDTRVERRAVRRQIERASPADPRSELGSDGEPITNICNRRWYNIVIQCCINIGKRYRAKDISPSLDFTRTLLKHRIFRLRILR